MRDIDKSKLVFINKSDTKITDVPMDTKEIGYYQDAWNRFKKNKASVIAFIIIAILLTFVIIGPYLKSYDLGKGTSNNKAYFANLPAKIPGLENLGIFDGTKTITRGKKFLTEMYHSEYGHDIIISGMPQELIDNPEAEYPKTELTVRVDFYKYRNYILSIKDEENNPSAVQTYTEAQFQSALDNNTILEIVNIVSGTDLNGDTIYTYQVRVDIFKEKLQQLPEDTYFWFGTDGSGRDLFTVLWEGSRISIAIAVVVVIINAVIGLILGAIAGYYGGTFDLIFDRFVDIISSVPFLAVITILIARFGSELWVIILAFTMTGWIGSYGSTRIQFYRFKNREYVLAAKTLGAGDGRIMFKHIFPNALGILITGFVLSIPSFIIGEATYSFLGIFDYGQVTSVGMLLNLGQQVMREYPHILLFPAVYISVLMIAFNLFGNGLRDAFNPSLRGVE